MQFQDKTRLLFIGDSITDGGRVREAVNSSDEGLGGGYVRQVKALLGAHYPERVIEVLNTGCSGNRITDLEGRWEGDVLALKPDWLSVMIGINDVWRQFDRPSIAQVAPEKFESVYDALLERTRPGLKGLVLMSPFFLEPDRGEPMRAMMDRYGAIARKLADKHDAVFADVQAAFDAYLAERHTLTLCADRVHPNSIGHAVIARAFLDAVGFRWGGERRDAGSRSRDRL
jgi:lysophospholipase L1-like esterase